VPAKLERGAVNRVGKAVGRPSHRDRVGRVFGFTRPLVCTASRQRVIRFFYGQVKNKSFGKIYDGIFDGNFVRKGQSQVTFPQDIGSVYLAIFVAPPLQIYLRGDASGFRV